MKLDKIYRTYTYENGSQVAKNQVEVRRDRYRRCPLTYPGKLSVNTTLNQAVYILEIAQSLLGDGMDMYQPEDFHFLFQK